MMIMERSLMFNDFNESFTLDVGDTSCMVEAPSSGRSHRESHPRAAPSPSVNSVRGGKMRDRDEVEWRGGGPSMCQVRRRGSRIKWFVAASDNGTVEVNSVNDDPQRNTTEERESLKHAGRAAHPTSTDRDWRADVGNAEIVEATAARVSWGTSGRLRDHNI